MKYRRTRGTDIRTQRTCKQTLACPRKQSGRHRLRLSRRNHRILAPTTRTFPKPLPTKSVLLNSCSPPAFRRTSSKSNRLNKPSAEAAVSEARERCKRVLYMQNDMKKLPFGSFLLFVCFLFAPFRAFFTTLRFLFITFALYREPVSPHRLRSVSLAFVYSIFF